jgi:hypothetical protein
VPQRREAEDQNKAGGIAHSTRRYTWIGDVTPAANLASKPAAAVVPFERKHEPASALEPAAAAAVVTEPEPVKVEPPTATVAAVATETEAYETVNRILLFELRMKADDPRGVELEKIGVDRSSAKC